MSAAGRGPDRGRSKRRWAKIKGQKGSIAPAKAAAAPKKEGWHFSRKVWLASRPRKGSLGKFKKAKA